jgi:hypothetical protein
MVQLRQFQAAAGALAPASGHSAPHHHLGATCRNAIPQRARRQRLLVAATVQELVASDFRGSGARHLVSAARGFRGLHLSRQQGCLRSRARGVPPVLNARAVRRATHPSHPPHTQLQLQQQPAAGSSGGALTQQQQPPASQQQHFAGGAPTFGGSTVEASFQVQYGCKFGQRLALISNIEGWEVASAVRMTWSAGDVWTAVLQLPVG